jgi:hypothetical protein
MFAESIGKTIRHEIQDNVMFKERLQSCKHQRESFGRIYRLSYNLVLVSVKTGVGNTYKSCAVWSRRKDPLNRCGRAIRRPFDEDSSISFNALYIHLQGQIYISHTHLICMPGSSLPLALETISKR